MRVVAAGVMLAALASARLVSAQQVPGPSEARSPILEGRVLFKLHEPRVAESPSQVAAVLHLETELAQSCLLPLAGDVATTDSSITVSWIGIPSSVVICPQASGPAQGGVPLSLQTGTYILRLGSRDTTDAYRVSISADAIEVLGTGRVTAPMARKVWRYPSGSVAIYCGSLDTMAEMCPRLREWLGRQSGLTEIRFPPGGEIPFPVQMTSYGVNDERRFYRLSDDASVDTLAGQIEAWLRAEGWARQGNGVRLRSAEGRTVSLPR
jgi:hypothetical protein